MPWIVFALLLLHCTVGESVVASRKFKLDRTMKQARWRCEGAAQEDRKALMEPTLNFNKLEHLDDTELYTLFLKMKALAAEAEFAQLSTYNPYPKQSKFHELGNSCAERALMAGNQLGKTYSAAMEAAMHATGQYPEWWGGRHWHRRTRGLVGGESSEAIRDTSQRLLLGDDIDNPGTGAIPKEMIIEVVKARGVQDAADYVLIKHISGGISKINFKSYEKGRKKFQGFTVDWVWLDEEPPEDIYNECLARITATKGMVFATFTPLEGRTKVVNKFWDESGPDRQMVIMTIDDVDHLNEEEAAKLAARYPKHQQDARLRGIPMMGSGLIYPYQEEMLKFRSFELPMHWPRLCAMDIGVDHPAALVWLAWDRDNDIVYVYDCWRMSGALMATICSILRSHGLGIPVAWPHDVGSREKSGSSGDAISDMYRKQGINMLAESARYEDTSKGNAVEAGIMDFQNRAETGRLKIAEHLRDIFDEIARYHRKDGKIVKEEDDLLDAIRYGIMSLRHAKVVDRVGRRQKRQQGKIADGIDYDVTEPYKDDQ